MYYDQSGQSYPDSIAKTVFNLWLVAHPTTTVFRAWAFWDDTEQYFLPGQTQIIDRAFEVSSIEQVLAPQTTYKVTIANGDVTNWWYLPAGAPLITSVPVPIDRITAPRQTNVSTGSAEALLQDIIDDAAHELFMAIYDHDPVAIDRAVSEAEAEDITFAEKMRRWSGTIVSWQAQGLLTRLANWDRVSKQLMGFAAGSMHDTIDERTE